MRKDINRTIIFLLSPFISLPFVLNGIYNKNKTSVFLFVGIISIVSFLYTPSLTSDKAYYYDLYESFTGMSFDAFYNFLINEKADFIFYFLIFFFSLFKVPLQFLFLILTFITVGLWYNVFLKLANLYSISNKKIYFILFLLILFSFSPPDLFSGVRFYLAASFTFYGFASFLISKRHLKGFIFILLGGLTHFSCFVFLPAYVLLLIKPDQHRLYFVIFLISFIFLFIPREYLLEKSNLFSLTELYENKATSYLGEEDFVEKSLNIGNFNNALMFFFKTLWVYLAYYYLIIFKKHNSIVKNAFFLVLALSNVFFAAPTIYHRFLILALGLFVLLIIRDTFSGIKNTKFIYILLIILGLNFFGNIYAMKGNFEKGINDIHSLTLITIFFKSDVKYLDLE